VLRFDLDSPTSELGTFFTYDNLVARTLEGIAYAPVLDRATLEAEWGGAPEPSGLAVLEGDLLVVADHASGQISLFGLDGTPVRTIDTGLGAGLGGLTVLDDTVYFTHLGERRVYRLDVVAPAIVPE
jgi:hypothetical protein